MSSSDTTFRTTETIVTPTKASSSSSVESPRSTINNSLSSPTSVTIMSMGRMTTSTSSSTSFEENNDNDNDNGNNDNDNDNDPSSSCTAGTIISPVTDAPNSTVNGCWSTNNPRSCILQVGVYAGRLCEVVNTSSPFLMATTTTTNSMNTNSLVTATATATPASSSINNNNTSSSSPSLLVQVVTDLLHSLWLTSCSLQLNMSLSIRNKLALNGVKYPINMCKGKAGKYTEYSNVTGITKSNQVTSLSSSSSSSSSSCDNNDHVDGGNSNNNNNSCSTPTTTTTSHSLIRSKQTLEEVIDDIPILAKEISSFAEDRSWTQYHTPRNLVLALLGEVGELAELVQFKGDTTTTYSSNNNNNNNNNNNGGGDVMYDEEEFTAKVLDNKEMDKLSQELADVSIYLLRLTYVCNIVTPLCEELSKRGRNNMMDV